jgi:gluconolactonase
MELEEVHVLAEGLAFPEGPVAMADGSVIFVEIYAGLLSRCDAQGNVSVVAEVGGGPNGAARGPDGAIYICNNGGQATPGGPVQPGQPGPTRYRDRASALHRGRWHPARRSE